MRERFDIGYETVHETLVHMIGNVRVWTDLMAAGSTTSRPDAWREFDLAGCQTRTSRRMRICGSGAA